jgi:hypothetical protein
MYEIMKTFQLKKHTFTVKGVVFLPLESRVNMYRLVETYGAQNVSKLPPQDKIHPSVSETADKPWYRNGIIIGSYVATTTLNQIPCLGNIESAVINPNKLRQMAPGQTQDGHNIAGYYVLSDVGGVYLFKNPKSANKWAKQIDPSLAPSLIWIDSGNENVS